MLWAPRRTAEKIEDRAYSLMGLFGVHTEMIYGEREQAFVRLQEQEYINQYLGDESVFARGLDSDNLSKGYSGSLAPLPSSFRGCSDIVPIGEARLFVSLDKSRSCLQEI